MDVRAYASHRAFGDDLPHRTSKHLRPHPDLAHFGLERVIELKMVLHLACISRDSRATSNVHNRQRSINNHWLEGRRVKSNEANARLLEGSRVVSNFWPELVRNANQQNLATQFLLLRIGRREKFLSLRLPVFSYPLGLPHSRFSISGRHQSGRQAMQELEADPYRPSEPSNNEGTNCKCFL